MSYPDGFYFLLPDGGSTKTLEVAEIGGLLQTVTAEQAAAYPQLVETIRNLLYLCEHGDFSNGNEWSGQDEGSCMAFRNYMEPAQQYLLSLGESPRRDCDCDKPVDAHEELITYACPFAEAPDAA